MGRRVGYIHVVLYFCFSFVSIDIHLGIHFDVHIRTHLGVRLGVHLGIDLDVHLGIQIYTLFE